MPQVQPLRLPKAARAHEGARDEEWNAMFCPLSETPLPDPPPKHGTTKSKQKSMTLKQHSSQHCLVITEGAWKPL